MEADDTTRLTKGSLPKLFLAVGLTVAAGILVNLFRESQTLSTVLALGVMAWAFGLLLMYLRSLQWRLYFVVSSCALF